MSPTFDWLDLLPSPAPQGWREALETARDAQTRHDATTRAGEDCRTALAGLVADPTADPATVRAAALDLLVARETASLLPPVPPVPGHYADDALQMLRAWFAQNPPRLGPPPLILAERRHALEMHAGQLAPDRTDHEREALPHFAHAATAMLKTRRTVALLTRDLDPGEDMADRVSAFGAYQPAYEQTLAEFAQVAALVEVIDAARLASADVHRCPLWSGAHCAPLMSLDVWPGATWTEALAMVDGLPVVAAAGSVLVGA